MYFMSCFSANFQPATTINREESGQKTMFLGVVTLCYQHYVSVIAPINLVSVFLLREQRRLHSTTRECVLGAD